MSKQETKPTVEVNTISANQVKVPTNPFQVETPPEVLEYLKLREMKELSEARIEELTPVVIAWGEEQIKQRQLTSKRLPIPELTKQGMELLITERQSVDKDKPRLMELSTQIAKEKEIAEVIHQKQIKLTLSKIHALQADLEYLTNTETGRILQKEYDEVVKSLTYHKKGLTLRSSH